MLAYTITAEIGDITRSPTPHKLAGYTGLQTTPTTRGHGRRLVEGGEVLAQVGYPWR